MSEKRWKRNERAIAARLGGRRVPITGRQRAALNPGIVFAPTLRPPHGGAQFIPRPRLGFGPVEPAVLLDGLELGDFLVMAPGEIYAPAHKFKLRRHPLGAVQRLVVVVRGVERLRILLTVAALADWCDWFGALPLTEVLP